MPVRRVCLAWLLGVGLFADPPLSSAGRELAFVGSPDGEAQFFTTDHRIVIEASRVSFRRDESWTRMAFRGSRQGITLEGEDPTGGRSYYLLGRKRSGASDAVHFRRVRTRNLYPGIDVVFRGAEGALEYDFVLAPGASSEVIRLEFEGVDSLVIEENGDLLLQVGGSKVRHRRPRIYQRLDGIETELRGGFQMRGVREVGFAVERLEPPASVVIDPIVSYATYAGGSLPDFGRRVAVDVLGYTYVVGRTLSLDFPTTGALSPDYRGGLYDAFVMKIDPAGSRIVFATYLGGSGEDWGYDVDVDASGSLYLSGRTDSPDFPLASALQPQGGGGVDGFLAKIDPTGASLVYSTYFGGSGEDRIRGIAVDGMGRLLAVGQTSSNDLPLENPLQTSHGGGTMDAFFARLSQSGESLEVATYLGGNGEDVGVNVAAADGGPVLTGFTDSSDFPLMAAFQSARRGAHDAFVSRLTEDGRGLVYSTYLGGSGTAEGFDEVGADVGLDRAGNAYVTGRTRSADFPTSGALQPVYGGGPEDAFLTKLDPAGALVYSTYLGGNGAEEARAVAVNGAGRVHIVGRTASPNWPLARPVQGIFGGGLEDAFVTVFDPGGALLYSDYFGGSAEDDAFGVALDRFGNLHAVGETASLDLPVAGPALQPLSGGQYDAFVTKITLALEVVVRLREDASSRVLLNVDLRNGGPAVRPVELKVWIESSSKGEVFSVLPSPTPVLQVPADSSLSPLHDVPLPAGVLSFPGSVVRARLLDAYSGAVVGESLCNALPCH